MQFFFFYFIKKRTESVYDFSCRLYNLYDKIAYIRRKQKKIPLEKSTLRTFRSQSVAQFKDELVQKPLREQILDNPNSTITQATDSAIRWSETDVMFARHVHNFQISAEQQNYVRNKGD